MKQKLRLIYTSFGLILMGMLFMDYSSGYDGNLAGAPGDGGTCLGCHYGGTVVGQSVGLSNIPLFFTAGQTYSLTLTAQHSAALKGGFQIVATNNANGNMIGTFAASMAEKTRLTGAGRLTHSSSKDFSGGSASWTFNWTAPATGSPANVTFYYVVNAANGNGGSGDGDAILAGSSATVLPIALTQFSATKTGKNGAHLTWQTASERNNRHFNVERSGNNQKFETIGQIKGNGTSAVSQRYEFTDDALNTQNSTTYYRLQQVDFDGNSTYSKTVSVVSESKATLAIYPNFAKKGDNLTLETVKNAQVEVFDISGRVVQVIQKSSAISQSLIETATLTIPTSDLPSGRYFVRLVGNGLVKTSSFVVL